MNMQHTGALDQFNQSKQRLLNLMERIREKPAAQRTAFSTSDGAALTAAGYLQDLARRVQDDTFRVAVIGEYSTGKSSILNVLLDMCDPRGKSTAGRLPTGISPTTAVVTVLEAGARPAVEGLLRDGTRQQLGVADLHEILSQPRFLDRFQSGRQRERKASMAAELQEVRIGCDASLLTKGVTILDTPGLGTVHHEHGEITRRCVANVDAVIFIICTDPPMGEGELTFLQYVAGFNDRFIFVQNMKDKDFNEGLWKQRERHHRAAIQQLLGHGDFPFFHVSALQAANALRKGKDELFASSGIPELRDYLAQFLVDLQGTPRLAKWKGSVQRALDLTLLQLRNERDLLEDSVKNLTGTAPSSSDYTRWTALRRLLDEQLDDYLDQVPNRLAARRPAIRVPVLSEAQPVLQRLVASAEPTAELIGELERQIVRSIQQHVPAVLEPEVRSALGEAILAVRQSLNDELPEALRRYQVEGSGDPSTWNLDLRLNRERLVRTTVTYREPDRDPISWILSTIGRLIFGGSGRERIETHAIDQSYVEEVINQVINEAVQAVAAQVVADLRQLKRGSLAEMDRIAAAAHQADEQRKAGQLRSLAESHAQLRTVNEELLEVTGLARELEAVVSQDGRLTRNMGSTPEQAFAAGARDAG